MVFDYQKGSTIRTGVLEGSARERLLIRAGFSRMGASSVPDLPSKTDAPVHPVATQESGNGSFAPDANGGEDQEPAKTETESSEPPVDDVLAKLEALNDGQLIELNIVLDLPECDTRAEYIKAISAKIKSDSLSVDELIAKLPA